VISDQSSRRLRNATSHAARAVVDWAGSASAAVVAVLVVASWVTVGVLAGFSDPWLAVLFALTGAVTFVMVFFIQHATGRDMRAILLKLDELVRASDGASAASATSGRALQQAQQATMPVVDHFDELSRLVDRGDVLYLRYSKGPAADAQDGPSRDYESGVDLPGLSVTTLSPEPWWNRPASDWVARRVCKYAELGGGERPAAVGAHRPGSGLRARSRTAAGRCRARGVAGSGRRRGITPPLPRAVRPGPRLFGVTGSGSGCHLGCVAVEERVDVGVVDSREGAGR
jgi:low affinity Fe/Cu permease